MKYFGFLGVAWFLFAHPLFGQAGNNNPGGVTAEFYGSVTTAGYYDPFTGNAKREVTDLVVPGSIGAYPLTYTRTYNTRGNGWTDNYSWGLSFADPDTNDCTDIHYCGPIGHVAYPAGNILDLWEPTDPGIWPLSGVNGQNGPDDVLVKCSIANSGCEAGAAYEIWRADGGKVLFEQDYWAYKIIDPYGQATTLTYDDGTPRRLSRITEPAGRYLQFNYQTYQYLEQDGTWRSVELLGSVQAYAAPGVLTETVSYGYEGVWNTTGYLDVHAYYLINAYYDDGAVATYTYQASNMNTGGNMGFQTYLNVLHTCDDPRYAGPMKFIEYEYVKVTEAEDVGQGQIKAEKNILHQVVSQISFPSSPDDPNLLVRTETRGDGPTRTFRYDANGFTWTDYKNHSFVQSGSAAVGSWTIQGPRGDGYLTTYECEGVLDALRKITFPQTDPTQPAATKEYTFTDANNPYYHSGEKDENGNWTYFDRDGNNRVWRIRYPDTSTEEFTYNGFGQVLTHKLRSGGTETFTYDTRGLKHTSYPPATGSDPDPWNHPTTYYYYQSGPNTDRLYMVIDPLQHATAYEYNQRGQVIKVQHQDYTYTQSHYNLDGTLDWTADENHPGAATDPNQRTRYTYDEYKRLLTVTNPMGEMTTNSYALDPDWAGSNAKPLLHTTNSVKYTLSPMQKNVVYEYDENLRKTYQGVALSTPDAAATFFGYDEVGNLITTTDPRQKVAELMTKDRLVTVREGVSQDEAKRLL
ncbi:MAG: hypothetical protein ABR611_07700, partial [Chthoniobacterales bacterium]